MSIADVVADAQGDVGNTRGTALAAIINEIKALAELTAAGNHSSTYWFDANDDATAGTPITHVGNATDTYLTNTAAGSETTEYNPDSKAALWNPVTNKFAFTSLKIGDVVNFRVDLLIDNLAAQEVHIAIDYAEGGSPSETKPVADRYYKTAANGTALTAFYELYIGSDNTKDYPARFRFESIVNASIVVIGFYYRITSV